MKTDKEILESNKHIPDKEVKQDITDTLAEIRVMEREIEGFEIIGDRVSNMKIAARISGIEERKGFVNKLQKLLQLRYELQEKK